MADVVPSDLVFYGLSWTPIDGFKRKLKSSSQGAVKFGAGGESLSPSKSSVKRFYSSTYSNSQVPGIYSLVKMEIHCLEAWLYLDKSIYSNHLLGNPCMHVC